MISKPFSTISTPSFPLLNHARKNPRFVAIQSGEYNFGCIGMSGQRTLRQAQETQRAQLPGQIERNEISYSNLLTQC